MTRQEMIAEVISILNANEEFLSDGFGYYCEDSKQLLVEIATTIVNRLIPIAQPNAELVAKLEQIAAGVKGHDVSRVCYEAARTLSHE